jgi:hypothetical protein
MAAKKKKKSTKTSAEKKKSKKKVVPKQKPKPKPAPKPILAAVDLPAPLIVVSYEMIARRAFLIWERKTHTNYPEQNWKEAEAELQAELIAAEK